MNLPFSPSSAEKVCCVCLGESFKLIVNDFGVQLFKQGLHLEKFDPSRHMIEPGKVGSRLVILQSGLWKIFVCSSTLLL